MEDKLLITSSMEGGRIEKEEFYEEIEAPKFVDFTSPNHFCPDDRFWFCSRVGCDQKHEEEMDSEAIYKNFVLRVMAARSPNVRFRKAMSRKPLSESGKCPHSAPPKSSKSRIPRLAVVASSISKKLIDDENDKLKVPTANVKPASTPKARVKHVAAKYMTSPRKKKRSSPNSKGFRSVRNPMKTSITLPKSKVVSKALVFNSPKKAIKKKSKASEELATPVTKLCEGVKKLQINSQKKSVARKPFKECTSERQKVAKDDSKRILSSCKTKRREVDAKTSGSVTKTKAKTSNKKHTDVPLREIGKGGDEFSDMDVETQSRCHSLELDSGRIKPSAGDHGNSQEEGTSLSEWPMTGESSDAVSLNTQKSAMLSGPASVVSAEGNTEAIQEPNVNRESEEKCNTNVDNLENQNPGVGIEHEDNDDKENASNTINIRNLTSDNVSKHDAPLKPKVKTKQNPAKLGKTSKENCPAGTGTQGLKNKKLKPTNPKPFRLRTDERGILKEATLERKANSREGASTASENSKATGNDNRENGIKKDEGKSSKKDQPAFQRPIKSKFKTAKEVEPKSEKSFGKTRSPFLQKQSVGHQREAVARVKSRETTMSKLKKVKQQREEVDVTKNASLAQKSAQQGKSPATIPREPKFHCLHKPKSCTTNQT